MKYICFLKGLFVNKSEMCMLIFVFLYVCIYMMFYNVIYVFVFDSVGLYVKIKGEKFSCLI